MEFVLDCKMTLQKDNLLGAIRPYQLVSNCFSKYITWVYKNDPNNLKEYDIIDIFLEKDNNRLKRLEADLEKARSILGVDNQEFINFFGFKNDLLTDEPEKFYDILAEPLVAIDLHLNGFCYIKKIRKQSTTADFTAEFRNKKFAIEIKTIREESWAQEGKPIDNKGQPNWWKGMFINKATTRIEDKNRRAITQLENTAKDYACNYKLLVFYTRRYASAMLWENKDYIEVLAPLKNKYPEIDYICLKTRFDERVVFYPDLPK